MDGGGVGGGGGGQKAANSWLNTRQSSVASRNVPVLHNGDGGIDLGAWVRSIADCTGSVRVPWIV